MEPTSSERGVRPEPVSAHLGVYQPSTFLQYVREDLNFESDLKYEVLSAQVRNWDFGPGGHGFLTVTDNPAPAMAKNPYLKVMIASGYFDLAAPYSWPQPTRSITSASSRDTLIRISQKLYPGGHMMYHSRPALEGMQGDVQCVH